MREEREGKEDGLEKRKGRVFEEREENRERKEKVGLKKERK